MHPAQPQPHLVKRRFAAVLTGVSAGYGAVALAALAVNLALPESLPFVGLVKSVIHLILAPSLVVLPMLVLARRWRVALLLVPSGAAFVLLYGGLFVPRTAASVGEGTRLSVLTYNLKRPLPDEVDALIAVMRAADADIVALQELSAPAAAAFDAGLADVYPYRALHPVDNPYAGQGILSRYPITADAYWRNTQLDTTLGHQRVEINVNGTTMTVYNTHPFPPFLLRTGFNADVHAQELDILLDRVDAERAPTLLLGDFNMSDQFAAYQRITRRFTDAYRTVGTVGLGVTFPAGGWYSLPPLFRIDYSFYDEHFTGVSARVLADAGTSDHFPVLVQLMLNEGAP